jgi:hypothetical protein
MDDVSVSDQIISPLGAKKSFLSRNMFRAAGRKIRKGNDLGPNKPSFHVGVDLPCGLGGCCPA